MTSKFLLLSLMMTFALSCPDENNCRKCQKASTENKDKCLSCFQGYVSKNGKCLNKFQVPIHNCKEYELKTIDSSDIPVCKKCNDGYFVESNKCKKCEIQNCAVCTSADTCLACSNSKKLILTPVPTCSEIQCELRNCELCAYSDPNVGYHCLRCSQGSISFNENRDECLKSRIPNCEIAASIETTECSLCREGFNIAGNGQCQADQPPKSHTLMFILSVFLLLLIAGVGVFLYEKFAERGRKENEENLI